MVVKIDGIENKELGCREKLLKFLKEIHTAVRFRRRWKFLNRLMCRKIHSIG